MGGVGINDNKHCTGKKHRGVCILQDVVVLTLVDLVASVCLFARLRLAAVILCASYSA